MAERMERAQSTDALLEAVFPKLLGATTTARRPEVVAQVRGWVRDAPVTAGSYAQRAMAESPDSVPTLAQVSAPALVVVGEEDVLSPPADADQMANALADVELLRIAEVGHLSPVEAPRELAEGLARLVARVGG